MSERAQLRDRLRRLRDEAAEKKRQSLACRIGLAPVEVEMELAPRQEKAARSIH